MYKLFTKNILGTKGIYYTIAILCICAFSIILSGLIAYLVRDDYENFFKLMVPMGVLLSAALASVSVMRNIDNTNRIEDNKKIQERNKNITFLVIQLANLFIKLNVLKRELENKIQENNKEKLYTLDYEILEETRDFFKEFNNLSKNKEILFNVEYNIGHKLFLLNKKLQYDIAFFISIKATEKDNTMLYSNIQKANQNIYEIKQDFSELESKLINQYGDEIPALKIIFAETYNDTIF